MLHLCPALYNYVVNEMKKHIILVLNKVDFAPVELVSAWKAYLKEKYPQLYIVCFTSHPKDVCSVGSDPGSGQCSVHCQNLVHVLYVACECYAVSFHFVVDFNRPGRCAKLRNDLATLKQLDSCYHLSDTEGSSSFYVQYDPTVHNEIEFV